MGALDEILKGKITDPNKLSVDEKLQQKIRKSSPSFSYNNRFETFEQRDIQGIDLSNRDYLTGFENPITQDINEVRANRQGWLTKTGAGLARATTKAGIEIAKMVPTIGGIVSGGLGQISDVIGGTDGTDFLETAFNNSWIKSLDNLNEDINTELLPVYVKKAVKEGNLWDNMTSIDFWATEGADGVGYMAAMLAPGALINKLGVGAKVFKGLNKLGGMSSKLDDAVVGLGKLGVTPGSVDVGSAALANTLFEAGAEAKGAGDSYVAKMTPKLEAGLISQEDFDLGKASAMRNTFVSNMAILAGPNLAMSKMLWGKGAKKAAGMLTNAEGELIKELPKKTLKGSIGRATKDFAGASAREGFFEEGLQSVSENYFVDKAVKGEDSNIFDLIGDLPGAYVDMISSTEGQKAVLLGSMLGGPMDVVMKKMQRNGERKAMKTLLPELHKLDGFYKVFADDIHNEQGEIDPVKFKEKAEALRLSEELSKAYDVAIESGDENAIEAIRAYTSGELVKNFIFNDELGIDALKQYLESSKTIEEVAQKEKKDVETISKSILDRAKKLQQDYNTFKDFAPSLITLENENSTKEDQVRYYDNLASRYITNKNLKYFYEDQLNKTVDQRKNLLSSLGITEELVTEDETLVKAEKDNFALKEVNDEIREFEKNLAQLKENDNNFWKKETHQKYFNETVKVREQFDKAQEEETAKKIEELQSAIENATTEEELDNIKYTGTVADKALKVAVKNKRAEIQTETARQHREKAEEQTTTSEKTTAEKELKAQDAEEAVNSLPNKYNVGDEFEITTDHINASNGVITKEDLGQTGRILDTGDITDSTIKVTLESGKSVVLKRSISREVVPNPNQEYQTEGSLNHDQLVPKRNENKESGKDTPFGNGTPIVRYDSKAKKQFGFVSDEYKLVEQEPTNKKGVKVGFKINRGNKVKSLDKPAHPLSTPFTQKQDGSGLVNIDVAVVEKEGVKKTNFTTNTTNKKGEARTQKGKKYNTLSELETEFDINWEYEYKNQFGQISDSNITNKEFIDSLLEGDDSKSVILLEMKEGHGIKTITLLVKGAQIDITIKGVKKITSPIKTKLSETVTPHTNINWLNALKGYDSLLKGEKLTKEVIEFLIDHLPISITLADTEAPIKTKYVSNGNTDKFDSSSKILRTRIINALLEGVNINDIKGTIQGQAAGELQVDPNINNLAPENEIKDLHFIHKLDKNKVTSTIRKNLMFVNQQGDLEYLNGDVNTIVKVVKGIGEVYLDIPMANGKKFPLKLNIQRINKTDADLLAKLYKLRFEETDINKSTTLSELQDKEFVKEVKANFKKQIELIGKSPKDTTIKDIVDFIIWDASTSVKTKVELSGTGYKGEKVFKYGDTALGGGTASSAENFDEEGFSQWLQENKRYNINLKPKKGADTKATVATNNDYLDYLLDSKILNTNAKVGKDVPTFQGFTGIFLDSNDITYPTTKKAVEVVTLDTTPFNAAKDTNLNSTTVNGKTYLASRDSGRTFESKRALRKSDKTVEGKELAGKVVTDNKIIEEVETSLNAIWDMPELGYSFKYNLKRSENKSLPSNKSSNITPTILVSFIGQGIASGTRLNKMIGASLWDTTAMDELESLGIVSKFEGAKGQRFLMNKEDALEKMFNSENKSQITRNSQKNSLTLQEIPNTVENNKVNKMKEKNEKTDIPPNVTEEILENVIEEVMDLGLLKDGSAIFNEIINAPTNEARFNSLKTLLANAKMDINDIITKCN